MRRRYDARPCQTRPVQVATEGEHVRGLAGKVAIVAGGAGGIGTATCVRLAEEGCTVAVGDLDGTAAEAVADRIRSAGGARSAGPSTSATRNRCPR